MTQKLIRGCTYSQMADCYGSFGTLLKERYMIDQDGNETKTVYEAYLLQENIRLRNILSSIEHETSSTCWCDPVEIEEGVFLHNDFLERE